MLELRPICENCGIDLAPSDTDAMICSFECTFCRNCVDQVLADVCPNCGGGFVPRPTRPATKWKGHNNLDTYPALTERRHRPVDVDEHRRFAETIATIPPPAR